MRTTSEPPRVDSRLLAAALALGALGAASAWVLTQAGPALVERAYREESWPMLNDIVSGRRVLPLGHYLDLWQSIARWIYGTLFGLAAVAALLSLATARRLLRLEPTAEELRRQAPGRYALANAVIGTVLLGSIFALVADAEIWPFSPYGMYSRIVDPDSVEMVLLYGVTDTDPPRDVPLIDESQIAPFDHGRLRTALQQLSFARSPERLYRKVLPGFLHRYRQRQREGRNDGPPLRGVRVYAVRWRPDPRASNAADPTEKTLLAERIEPGPAAVP